MVIVKTSEMEGSALDYAVALCEGYTVEKSYGKVFWVEMKGLNCLPLDKYCPSLNWAQGGPIIERELICLMPYLVCANEQNNYQGNWSYRAYILGPDKLDDSYGQQGPTSLIAAMRCYVASSLGDTVDIPEELLK